MTIQLHEITPALIEQLLEQSEEDRLRSLVRSEVQTLARQYKRAKAEYDDLLNCCKMRARRLHNLGVDHEAIAEMFEVPVRTIGAWVRSSVTVIAKG